MGEIIGEIDASHTTRQEAEGGERRGGAKAILSGLMGGAVPGGLATAALLVFGLQFQPYNPIAATLMRQYNETAPLVPEAVDYLHKVADAVVEMQKRDLATLEAKASSRFVGFAAVDPELAKKIPQSMPPDSTTIVRTGKKNCKIMFNWTLCGTARFANPEMIEPVRSRQMRSGALISVYGRLAPQSGEANRPLCQKAIPGNTFQSLFIIAAI